MHKCHFCFFLVLFFSGLLFSQSNHIKPDDEFYSFIQRMYLKGYVDYNGFSRVLSRTDASLFLESLQKQETLTKMEKDEINFWQKEFYPEIKQISEDSKYKKTSILGQNKASRFNLFQYASNDFDLTVNPILGYQISFEKGNNKTHFWNGLEFFGSINNSIGFNLDFRDNNEAADRVDKYYSFSNRDGIKLYKYSDGKIEYSSVNAVINYSWSSGMISFGKEKLHYGNSTVKNSQIIISQKTPSFPHLRYKIKPVDWFEFEYLHGWLISNILDSSSVRKTLVEGRDDLSPIDKFIAFHSFTFMPYDTWKFTLGESIIYSNKIEPLYLIPVMFFRLGDHYIGDNKSDSGDNAQLFFDTEYKIPSMKLRLYSTFYMDEFSLTAVLENNNGVAAVAYTFGLQTADLLFQNNLLTIEYSRLNPFVYMNSNDAQLFTSDGYQLGHWIGSNGDQWYASLDQWYLRGLKSKLSVEYTRKGSVDLPEAQYQLPYPDFLHGTIKSYLDVEFSVQYSLFNNLTVLAAYNYYKTTDKSVETKSVSTFKMAIYFGL